MRDRTFKPPKHPVPPRANTNQRPAAGNHQRSSHHDPRHRPTQRTDPMQPLPARLPRLSGRLPAGAGHPAALHFRRRLPRRRTHEPRLTCPPQHPASAPDADAQHPKANPANAAQRSKAAATQPQHDDGASCAPPNSGTDPICEHDGCRRPATEVDHRTPIAEGGERFSFDNLTSYCAEHHRQKSTADALRGKQRRR